MIARVLVLLDEPIYVRSRDVLEPVAVRWGDYDVQVWPPQPAEPLPDKTNDVISARPADALRVSTASVSTDVVQINEARTVPCRILQLDFRRATFDRRNPSNETEALDLRFGDPSTEQIFDCANQVISALRGLLRDSNLQPLIPGTSTYRLEYLTDDQRRLEDEPGRQRTRSFHGGRFSVSGLSGDVWSWARALLPTYEAPEWHTLLLEADRLSHGLRPSAIGAPIALANAALEAYVSVTLDGLADASAALSPSLWDWMNDRGNWLRNPSVEEQYSVLLAELTGHSLKEDASLWQEFIKLRKARNSFSHRGNPEIDGVPVTVAQVSDLVASARRIVDWVEQLLPPTLSHPRFPPGYRITTKLRVEKASDSTQVRGIQLKGDVEFRVD